MCTDFEFEEIKRSPRPEAYRNKMEFSFGDEVKDGPLALGMHKRGSFYDIVNVPGCRIVDEDFGKILTCVLEYCKEEGLTYYRKLSHEGYLRHLLVRKGAKTGEILVDIVTSTQQELSLIHILKEKFGDAAEPLIERLTKYFQILYRNHFIGYVKEENK